MEIMEIEKCPHGDHKAKCTKQGCVFQQDKWKGEDIPSVAIEEGDAGKYSIICEDAEE